MARGSVGRQVARAARTGGGRAAARRSTPWTWYATIAAIVVLGVALVAWSRQEKFHPHRASATGGHPTLQDHWQSALGVDLCGQMQPAIPQPAQTGGIYPNGKGLIEITPLGPQDEGSHATLGRFVAGVSGMKLTATSLQYPGGRLYTNGDRCGNNGGEVQLWVWSSPTASSGHRVTGDPSTYRLANKQLLTLAFAPPGTKIPKPPASAIVALLGGSSGATTPTTAAPTPTTPTTAAPTTTTPPTTAAPTPTTPTTAAPTTTTPHP